MIREIEMNGATYQFNFGMGFLREMNSRAVREVGSVTGSAAKKGVGFALAVAYLIDGDVDTLADVLYTANAGQKPRLTRAGVDEYLEDDGTDIDKLFEDVLDFLRQSNATAKDTKKTLEAAEQEKKKAEK